MVTADEIPDPNQLAIQLRLNGQVMQRSNTANFIFNVAQLIAYVSQVCTLASGRRAFYGHALRGRLRPQAARLPQARRSR